MATPILPRVLWCASTAAALALGVVCTRPVAALSCDFRCYAVEGTLAECTALPPDEAGARLLDVTLIDTTVREVPCRHAGAQAGMPRITDESAALQLDGRIANTALAERVNLSESACLRRVRALEESGLVEGYTALLNQSKAGCPVNVFVNITLDRQDETDLRKFEEAVRKIPEVMECYLMTGDYDFFVRVVVADTADFERLHSKHLTRLPGVARVHSSFALRTVQKARELPIR